MNNFIGNEESITIESLRNSSFLCFFTEMVQVLCIINSICIMAIRTTSFQRYESQRISGRKVPWAMWLKKYRIQVI